MTKERYLKMREQMGLPPLEHEIPPDLEDFPPIVSSAIDCFNRMGDRVAPEVGYMGKDYTNFDNLKELYHIPDMDFFLSVIEFMDAKTIKKSQEQIKQELEKLKRKNGR